MWQLKSHFSWFLGFWAGSRSCREPRALPCRSQMPSPWQKPGKQKLPWSFQAPCWQVGSRDAENTEVTILSGHPTLSSAGCPWSGQPGGAGLAILSPREFAWQCSLQTCKAWQGAFRPNRLVLKTERVSNLSWRKKLVQNLTFTFNVPAFSGGKLHSQKSSSHFCSQTLPYHMSSGSNKKEHSWTTCSMLLSTFPHYTQPICWSFIWKHDEEPNSLSDTEDLFPDS